MKHLKRLSVAIAIFVMSVILILSIGTDDITMNPVGITILLTAKLSFAIIVWYILRKTIGNDTVDMDWNKNIKEVNIYDIFSLLSFVVIVLGVIFSYS